ncbi:MAG: acyltransferase family protein [Rickettsia endosymbiont of Pentastiridius leporinus]
MNNKIETIKEIKGLTGLRGYAALWVFFLHATYGWSGDSIGINIARPGGLGVVIFFVLSGFILCYVYNTKFYTNTINYKSFLLARIARVYPLHLFMLLFVLIQSFYFPNSILPSDNFYTFFLNIFLIQAWGFTDLVSWNQPSWSISTEMFAYLLFPFLILFMQRLSIIKLLMVLILIFYWIIFSPYASFIDWMQAHKWIGTEGKQFAYGKSLIMFLGVFIFGCVIFFVTEYIKFLKLNYIIYDIIMFTGVMVFVYIFTVIKAETAEAFWYTSIGSALIIIGISKDEGLSKIIFGNPITHFLGQISYALYLSALTTEYFVAHYWIYPTPLWLKLFTAVIAATILHYIIELPVRKLIRKFIY